MINQKHAILCLGIACVAIFAELATIAKVVAFTFVVTLWHIASNRKVAWIAHLAILWSMVYFFQNGNKYVQRVTEIKKSKYKCNSKYKEYNQFSFVQIIVWIVDNIENWGYLPIYYSYQIRTKYAHIYSLWKLYSNPISFEQLPSWRYETFNILLCYVNMWCGIMEIKNSAYYKIHCSSKMDLWS